jgi:uncharacterized membrane protein YphA (DoxX/SURF4 family)
MHRYRIDAAAAFPISCGSDEIEAEKGTVGAAPGAMELAMKRIVDLVPWFLTAFIVYIFIFYLQFKFTGHPGSVQLFTTLTDWLGFHGYEKVMRIGTGSMELLASVLLVVPASHVVGAALSLGIMTGAIFFHLASPLGVDPYGDGGVLFHQACAVWLSSAVILLIRRRRVVALVEHYLPFVPIPAKLRVS